MGGGRKGGREGGGNLLLLSEGGQEFPQGLEWMGRLSGVRVRGMQG